ncbi:MAG: ribosome-associated translation inhibitor RaiA [Caldilineales bacterium]|nr:ribosome-associated translation inhibitor RaiA [Caldilineales bacterium]
MKLTILAHNVEVTDWLNQYVEKKVGKLDRYLPDIDEARVELREEKTRSASDRAVAQVTLRSPRTILRAEERTGDMFASIDAVTDKLERRIERFKGKTARNSKRAVAQASAIAQTITPLPSEEDVEELGGRIVRIKRFPVLPMDANEAIEQMELLGHDFYLFLNAESGGVNVVYRRRGGDFGVLQPELV